MKIFVSSLIKKNWSLLNSSLKRPYLFEKNKRLAGKILCVMFNKFSTFFEISDFEKKSKKHRSNVVDVQVKDIFQYNFIGICIAHKKGYTLLNNSFLLRNTFDRVPYEMSVSLFSPIIDAIIIYSIVEKIVHVKHSKYFYLRKKPMPMSSVVFDYVTDMFEHDDLSTQSNFQNL